MRAYRLRDDVRARKAAYMQAYWRRPEVKERHRLRQAKYRARLRRP